MGDLNVDTAVAGRDGRYTASVSPDWLVILPNGGFISSIALRAAAAESLLPRPAALSVHYLNPPATEPVEMLVTSLRASKRAESLRVSMQQNGKPILEALVWMAADALDGFEHEMREMPAVPTPEEIKPWTPPEGEPLPEGVFQIWKNLDMRMEGWNGEPWEKRKIGAPVRRDWCRFRPRATFDDPVVDAARAVILIDTQMFPAAMMAQPEPVRYTAPSMDLSVWFHASACDEPWLLCEAAAPIARNGLMSGNARVWSRDGTLVASGGQQMLSRPWG